MIELIIVLICIYYKQYIFVGFCLLFSGIFNTYLKVEQLQESVAEIDKRLNHKPEKPKLWVGEE